MEKNGSLGIKNSGRSTGVQVAQKSTEYDKQQCYQMCDNSSLYMYFKKLGFSGFSLPVEPEIRIFFSPKHVPMHQA